MAILCSNLIKSATTVGSITPALTGFMFCLLDWCDSGWRWYRPITNRCCRCSFDSNKLHLWDPIGGAGRERKSVKHSQTMQDPKIFICWDLLHIRVDDPPPLERAEMPLEQILLLSFTLNPIRPGLFWYLKDPRGGGADLPPPYIYGGSGWEVPKLSWNLISYRDWCQTKGFMTFRYLEPP